MELRLRPCWIRTKQFCTRTSVLHSFHLYYAYAISAAASQQPACKRKLQFIERMCRHKTEDGALEGKSPEGFSSA